MNRERVPQTDEALLQSIRARRRRERDQIPDAEVALLMEFFSELGCAFERSVTGAVLEHQELAGATSRRCRKCHGRGIIQDDGFDQVLEEAAQEPQRKDSGRPIFDATKAPEKKLVKRTEGAGYCNRCRGLGSVSVVYDEERASRCADCTLEPAVRFVPDPPAAAPELPPDQAPPEPEPIVYGPWERPQHRASRQRLRRSQCRACCGMGRGPTIYVAGREGSSGGSAPDDGKLGLYAMMSRRVGRMRARGTLEADCLRDLFGDLGNRWAATKYGRAFALCHRTPAGKRLARLAEAWAARERSGRRKPLTRKEAAERIRWRNPAASAGADPFAELEARATATELRARERLERDLAEQLHGLAASAAELDQLRPVPFVGPVRRRPPPRRFGPKLVCWLDEHPKLTRKRDALQELEEQINPVMTPQERIGWVADLVTKHEQGWSSLLATARAQARDLERRTAIAWNRSGGLPKTELAAVIRLVERAQGEGLEGAVDYIRRHAGVQ